MIRIRKNIDCKDYRKQFHLFLGNKLDARGNGQLLKHIDSCNACREELRTQFLVVEGLKRLETGDSFDLTHDFEDMIERSKEKNRHIQTSHLIMGIAGAIMLSYTLLFLLMGII